MSVSCPRRRLLSDLQEGHARSEALASNENFSQELETNRAKVTNLENKLVSEEAELDDVRESLKGEPT